MGGRVRCRTHWLPGAEHGDQSVPTPSPAWDAGKMPRSASPSPTDRWTWNIRTLHRTGLTTRITAQTSERAVTNVAFTSRLSRWPLTSMRLLLAFQKQRFGALNLQPNSSSAYFDSSSIQRATSRPRALALRSLLGDVEWSIWKVPHQAIVVLTAGVARL